jgi:hypothetical protein
MNVKLGASEADSDSDIERMRQVINAHKDQVQPAKLPISLILGGI